MPEYLFVCSRAPAADLAAAEEAARGCRILRAGGSVETAATVKM